MILELPLQAALAGLSAGGFCVSTCFPFLVPYFAAAERPSKANILALLEFLGGRLAGYLIFGAVFGFLGESIQGIFFHLINHVALILLSLVLIFYLTGIPKGEKPCGGKSADAGKGHPLLLGFLLGINICPPFWLSLSYVVSLKSLAASLLYFFVFFIASSLYFLPLFFAGLLARMREIRFAARISGWLVGILFILYGTFSIIRSLGG